MALSSVAFHWRSSRWLRHAPSLPPLLLPPFPFRPTLPLCFSLSLLVFSSGLRIAELWDKEVQACLTFLDPLVEHCWQLQPNAFAVFLFWFFHKVSVHATRSEWWFLEFLWKALDVRDNVPEKWKGLGKSRLARVWDVFCWAVWAEGLGTALYIWQIDFCQQLSSDRLPAFEEEDQICGSMLCAGWTPKCT